MDAPNNFVEVPTTSWHMSCATEFRSEVFDKAVLKHQKKKKKKKKRNQFTMFVRKRAQAYLKPCQTFNKHPLRI